MFPTIKINTIADDEFLCECMHLLSMWTVVEDCEVINARLTDAADDTCGSLTEGDEINSYDPEDDTTSAASLIMMAGWACSEEDATSSSSDCADRVRSCYDMCAWCKDFYCDTCDLIDGAIAGSLQLQFAETRSLNYVQPRLALPWTDWTPTEATAVPSAVSSTISGTWEGLVPLHSTSRSSWILSADASLSLFAIDPWGVSTVSIASFWDSHHSLFELQPADFVDSAEEIWEKSSSASSRTRSSSISFNPFLKGYVRLPSTSASSTSVESIDGRDLEEMNADPSTPSSSASSSPLCDHCHLSFIEASFSVSSSDDVVVQADLGSEDEDEIVVGEYILIDEAEENNLASDYEPSELSEGYWSDDEMSIREPTNAKVRAMLAECDRMMERLVETRRKIVAMM